MLIFSLVYVFLQESLFISERCPPPPIQIKSLSPSPILVRSHRKPHHSRLSTSSLSPQLQPIPLITKTGPNCNQNLITIIRQHSQPEPIKSSCCQYACCSSNRSLQLHVPTGTSCCPPSQAVKRLSSVGTGAEEIANIAAESMKNTGGLKQFKQVKLG